MPELFTIYHYMRTRAGLLGERILQEYPALHQFDDAVSPLLAENRDFLLEPLAVDFTSDGEQAIATGADKVSPSSTRTVGI